MTNELAMRWRDQWQAATSSPDLFEFFNDNASATPAEKVDVILVDQGKRWQTSDPLRVEDYLRGFSELASDEQAVYQLVVGEFESRLACDTKPSIDEYTSRFSSLGETLRSRLQQIAFNSGASKSNSGNPDLQTSDDLRSPPVLIDETVDSSRLSADVPETLTYAASYTDSSVWIGRYRRIRLLGEGAFGRVWLGQDDELGRRVAIKVPRVERFRGPDDAEAYLAEARTVAGLDHPHIVPVYDVGRTEDGSVFVVSKFIEGQTLGERIKQSAIEFDDTAKLLATAAQALDHAHQQRLIHRDIKPDNILLEERTGTAYVADFGLAISEEQYLRDSRLAGTPAYMSPEQARGEGHRLDGRSDIFSLGVVFYEMLTRNRPFRGSSASELLHQVISFEPSPPRDINDSVPAELERICLKSLSKRAADRYPTAREMAEDLSQWQQGDNPSLRERTIVPRGLRSFGADDADFFLELLPGPRDRDGLPESIRFWKSRIEQTDPEQTFNVGLVYGPSGCGKSSLMKAGLLPRLSKQVVPLYIEATPDDTENRILRGLRKLIHDLPETLSLVESFAWLRLHAKQKVIIVLDQFEQWLHSHASNPDAELIAALRQCDGGHLQAIAMVRDDFAMAAARFMDALEVPILQGENFATVDLFDVDHAERVLIKFGQAFGKLPSISASMTDSEREFVSQVASGLADDGKVVSVRLSLFAEMVKGKPWTLNTLEEVGGTDGIGVNFLEDTFSSRNANPKHRLHEKAARAVLATLLPEIGSNIKGHMRSHAELLSASGYESQLTQFATLMQFLDGELRLITPTDPDGDQSATASDPNAKFYQLAHDYMVPSLRQWLTRKQQETRSGRAELKLDERTNLWTAKPENRHLPSAVEWAGIRSLTDRSKWTPAQQRMMQRAGRVHTSRMSMAIATLVLLACGGFWIKSRVDLGNQQTTASGLVAALLSAETRDVPRLVAELAPYRVWTDPELETALSSTDGKPQLHARIAMLPMDPTQTAPLQAALLDATPENVMVLRDVLQPHSENLSDSYWQILRSTDETKPQRRLSAAAALAKFAPEDPRWNDVATSVTKLLVDENPLRLATWIEAFRPVRASLIPELGVIFRDQSEGVTQTQRDLATNVLETYADDDVDELADLILDAQPKQFAALFDEFEAHGDAAKTKMLETLDREPAREKLWDDADVVSLKDEPVATDGKKSIEAADGMITDRFALVQTLKLDQFTTLTETLSKSDYRPVRLRPYNSQAVKPNPASAADVSPPLAAAIWHRDGRPWRVAIDLTAEEIQARDEQLRGEGFAAVDVAGYISVRDEEPAELFAAVWLQRNDDSDESRIYAAASDNDHKTTYGELEKSGYKFQQTLHVFRGIDGQTRHNGVKLKQDVIWTGVWDRSPANYGEILYLDRPQWDIGLTLGKSFDASQSSLERQIAETTAALEKKPEDRSARLRRAVAFYQQSKFTEAINDLDQLIEKSPSFPDSYQYRALCYARLANGNSAEDDLKNLRELLKSPAAIAYTTAIVQAYGGDFTSGEKTLADFALIIPEQGDGFYSIACAYAILASISKPTDQTRSSNYARKAIEALKVAIDSGETDTEQILIELDFDSIRESPNFKSLLELNQIDRRYAAIWNRVAGLESQELHGMSPTEHRQAMRHLELDDFIPVSISALVTETVQESVAASVWHRKTIAPTVSEELAKQQANAAAALARLGESDKIFAALRITDDPESLTQFVHRCRGEGVTTTELLECLTVADQSRQSLSGDLRRVEDRVLYGLLLALGEFAVDELPPTQRDAAVDQVAKWFSDDPSSAIHGVTGWLLRHWGQTDIVQQVDQTTRAYDPNREWFTLVIDAGDQRFYQTYVVIPPGEYDIGSPADAPGRNSNEIRNRVRLTRPVAILDREVTRGEFEASGVHKHSSTRYSPTVEHPTVAPSWYDSVQYCRWLTERAGFSEAEQAYADPATLDKAAYPLDGDAGFPKNWPLELNKRGFRLPTEAEWEIAARGGMRSTYGFGEDESLLNRYDWFQENSNRQTHLAKELRPNLRGLFDMHGSACEWCHDWYSGYDTGSVRTDPAGANSGSDRVNRGGGWSGVAAYCRTASRNSLQPTNRLTNYGLRVALVPFEDSKRVAEPESVGTEGASGAATGDAVAAPSRTQAPPGHALSSRLRLPSHSANAATARHPKNSLYCAFKDFLNRTQ